jgi:hypothetical protein
VDTITIHPFFCLVVKVAAIDPIQLNIQSQEVFESKPIDE